jgi:hypothetical protein
MQNLLKQKKYYVRNYPGNYKVRPLKKGCLLTTQISFAVLSITPPFRRGVSGQVFLPLPRLAGRGLGRGGMSDAKTPSPSATGGQAPLSHGRGNDIFICILILSYPRPVRLSQRLTSVVESGYLRHRRMRLRSTSPTIAEIRIPAGVYNERFTTGIVQHRLRERAGMTI